MASKVANVAEGTVRDRSLVWLGSGNGDNAEFGGLPRDHCFSPRH